MADATEARAVFEALESFGAGTKVLRAPPGLLEAVVELARWRGRG